MNSVNHEKIRQTVRDTYGKIAQTNDGCGCGCGCAPDNNMSTGDVSVGLGYTQDDVSSVPNGANMGLGCGNPQAIASLSEGETVIDLGSGGGFDCFLAARAVGKSGHVIGIDMTSEMVRKARENAVKAGYENVEFRLGEIENIPVADNSADVIISNCVINLSPEKTKVFNDAYRVLKPGGRLAVSDIVAVKPLPEDIRNDLALHAGCVAGASQIEEIKTMLTGAGFEEIRVTPFDESRAAINQYAPGRNIGDYIVSATIEAIKGLRPL
ncbi:arsenite methyltransferase [Candidatus Latescibacterota bacterium]